MADSISDDFATANGIAAYALTQEILMYLETIGVPRQQIIGITMAAQQKLQGLGKMKRHAALPIAADLLAETAQRLQATRSSSH